ncbi:hypothetical protein ACFU8W_39345 [Streptomyces sp. NPDC057565]|uniref:hypothetical protein n=1 Tax=Streptomyces sp. NPDC057565 TaxID=3346169 RepID=UPI0036A31782
MVQGVKVERVTVRTTAHPPACDCHHTPAHGDNLVAATASTRELMTRMGHSTARAALICQHMTADRDRAIADRLGAMIRKRQGDAGT